MGSLQEQGSKALANAPQPLRRALDGLNTQFRPFSGSAAPMAGGLGPGNQGIIAGIAPHSPNTISVMQPDVFAKNADQLVTHEGVHEAQNNWAPAIQRAIPPDNPNDPYNYGGTEGVKSLLARGGTLANMPREQAAAAMQYGQSQGMPEPYNQLAHTMDKIPLSTIEMTDPSAKLINTKPRTPQVPPSSVPGMNFATDTYKKGQAAPGDDPYASIAKPIQSDPYADIAGQTAPTQPVASPDSRNDFQKSIDNATAPQTPQERSGHGRAMNGLLDFGQAAAQTMFAPIAHPIEAAKGMASAATPDPGIKGLAEGALLGPAGPTAVHTAQGLYSDAKQNGVPHALGTLGGTFAAGEAAAAPLKAMGAVSPKIGAGVNNALIGTTTSDIERGANPGAALSQNHISAFTPSGLLDKVSSKIGPAAAEHSADISRFTRPGALINAGKTVSAPFDTRIASATDPTTGVAMPSQVNRARLTQRLLTHVTNPDSGQVTPMMRNPNLSPLDANRLKSSIYAMADYSDPYKSSLSNAGLKDAAHGLKSEIESSVPEAKGSGQRLHNLMSAKDILIPQAEGTKLIPASKSGLIERGVLKAGTTGASLLDRAGNGLPVAGDAQRFTSAPLLLPPDPNAPAPLGTFLNKKDRSNSPTTY